MTAPAGAAGGDPELALLLGAVRRALEGDSRPKELPAALDLARLFALARRHRLVPHLCRELLGGEAALGEEARRQVGEVERRTARRARLQAAELARLTGALEERGIGVLALKGPELAVEVFGDVTRRWCRDLDLLVRRRQVGAAARALLELGYEWELPAAFRFESRLGRAYLAHGAGQVTFRHAETGILVEIHWKLAHPEVELPLGEDRLWAGTRRLEVDGGRVATLARPALLVYLCHHGSRHRWRRLHWLADVAGLARVYGEGDWREAVELAGETGVGPALGLAATLAEELLGAPVPAPLAGRGEWLVRGRRLAREVRPQILDPAIRSVRFESVRARQRWGLALQRRWRNRLRPGFWLWPLALAPADLAGPRLPDRLTPLLYVARPFRAILRGLGSGRRSGGPRD